MRKLFKNVSLYTFGKILNQAAAFLLLPLYTRCLIPADYGIVNAMLLLATIFMILFTLTLDRSIYRLYYDFKTEAEKRDYLGTVTIFIVIFSLIFVAILLLSHNLVEHIYKSITFYPYYFLIIMTTFLQIFSMVPKIYLQVKEMAVRFVVLSFTEFILSTIFIIWFVVVAREGAVGMLKGPLFSSLLMLPLYLYILYKIINLKFKFNVLIDSLKYSLPLVPAALGAWMLNLSDRIFIERYISLADVGIYSLGYKLGGMVLIFTGAFSLAYNPIFFKLANSENQEEAKKKLFAFNNTFIILVIFLSFAVAFFSKELIFLLLDHKYYEAYKIVPIIALAYLISQVSGLFELSIGQDKKNTQLMFMILGSAAINIILNFTLIPRLGIYGAAFATVLSFAAYFAFQYWYSQKCYFIPINWERIIPLSLTLMAIVAFLQYGININIYISLVIKMLVFLAILVYFFKRYYLKAKNIFFISEE